MMDVETQEIEDKYKVREVANSLKKFPFSHYSRGWKIPDLFVGSDSRQEAWGPERMQP